MPYSYSTFGELKTQLAQRLGDASKVFWTDLELTTWLVESLRTFGVLSGFWRERGSFSTSAATAFYDLPTQLPLALGYTVTDYALIQAIQYALLENPGSQSSWSGTEMFTLDDVTNAVQNRRNQFLSDTGIVVSRQLVSVVSPPSGRQVLPQSIIDVRRAAWLGASPLSYYTNLYREDERMLTAYFQDWSVTEGLPQNYSVMAPPPLQLQLAPPPLNSGQLELLTVDSGAALTPASSSTILSIPDDLTPAVKWGALADLLGIDGIARDPFRAEFCEARYQQFVILARQYPTVLHAELQGVPQIPITLAELDAANPGWQNLIANRYNTVQDIALAAPNLIAVSVVPDQAYSVTLDVIRKTPIPISDAANIQLGREQVDAIVDYAEHLSLFKVGGAEFQATTRQANNFLKQSVTYNMRISAAACAAFSASEQSQRQKSSIPRRLETSAVGVGALKIDPDAGN